MDKRFTVNKNLEARWVKILLIFHQKEGKIINTWEDIKDDIHSYEQTINIA